MGETFDDAGLSRRQRAFVDAAHVVVAIECDRPLAGSARYSLAGVDRVTIGRGEARSAARHEERRIVTLDLRIPGRSMSSEHARLVRIGRTWALEDSGSKNGTFVNGERVARAVLEPEDLFELGHTLLRVNQSLSTPVDAPLDVDASSSDPNGHRTLDPALDAQLAALSELAESDVPVLVLGESGTGKEVLARWLHARTARTGDLVAVNCGAIPEALVESQLFGHMKGSFSGAVRDELGFVRAANNGTLFLDEIADLPKASQAALLRVLQEREVVPVGAIRPTKVDMRLVAATHQPISDLVSRGEFRRDLFARIAGFTITLPALRDRRDDLGLFVAALLPKVAPSRAQSIVLSPDVGRAFLRYDWPLNVRELEQCLALSAALAKDGWIERAHLPPAVARALDAKPVAQATVSSATQGRDDRLLLELLAQLAAHDGNLAEVARAMGKARMQIHRWCKRFGIDPDVYRP
jgi:DNA-binding NtrC family response regulator